MIGKRLINTGVAAAADALVPSENFNTVLYTGNGSTQRIGGYINRGGVFNGSSSYISAASAHQSNFSVSAWVYANSLTETNWYGSRKDSSNLVTIGIDASGKIKVFNKVSNTWSGFTTTSAHITTNTWHHVVVNFTSSDTKIYVDGTDISNDHNNHTTSVIYGDSYIGATNTTAVGSYWNGKIDQVRIFNKALSSSEVTTLYGETHASTTISTTDIFDDNSGVALYQLDGNANDTGGASGKYGAAAHFNGSNSKIDIGNQTFLNSDYTLSMWFYPQNTSGTSFQVLATKRGSDDAATPLGSFGIYEPNHATNPQKLVFNVGGGGTNYNYVYTSNTYNLNSWNHAAIKISGTSMSITLNGTESTGTFTGTRQTNSETIRFGNKYNTDGDYPFDGRIDDIRIYSDGLTSTEIGYIYNNTTASIPTDNLVAYYKLDGDARDEQQLYDGTATNVSYAYDGTATNVTYQEATKFQPDLVWIKNRDAAVDHRLFDSIRGSYLLAPNTDGNEALTTQFSSFDSNGFTLGGSASNYNSLNNDYVAWCFKGGGTAVSNTDGTLTSQVSANTDAGFSIVTYTATSSTETAGHGLSATPELVLIKRTSSPNYDWIVYTNVIDSSVDYLILNSTAAKADTTKTLNSTVFTTPSTGDFVAYSFHSVEGYSKVGSYTGTGTAGNMVETGFEPAWIMIKQTNTSGSNWNIIDNKRDTENPREAILWADTSDTESTASQSGAYDVNFLSNGFSLENTYQPFNASGGTYIYLAIAADPDTTTPTVENSFDVVTYTGTGSTQDIETDFKPDLVWVKNRTGTAYDHKIADSVRGATKILESSTTDAEITATGSINAFNTNGFTIGTDNSVNGNGNNFVAWCWKAGDHDENLPQINTEGSIDSVVSVNAEAGFSIVKWSGDNSTATIGHGLSSAPEIVIRKRLDNTSSWAFDTTAIDGSFDYLFLNTTAAKADHSLFSAPTSTVFSTSGTTFNASSMIAYCFHSVSGYQKIGTYAGNGGTRNIALDFKPRWIMIKAYNGPLGWYIFDSTRHGSDTDIDKFLRADVNNAEGTTSSDITFETNNVKIVSSSNAFNGSAYDYIYLAIK